MKHDSAIIPVAAILLLAGCISVLPEQKHAVPRYDVSLPAAAPASVATAEKSILLSAKHRYILCDSSKIGQSAVAHITSLKNCDALITGKEAAQLMDLFLTVTKVLYA